MSEDRTDGATAQAAGTPGGEREIELEIISNSWLSLTCSGGFDAMLASWARKIDAHEAQLRDDALVDRVVMRQFEPIDSLLKAQTEFRHADPLERETQITANPVMILSPDGTVAAAANRAESFFRIALGRRAGRDWLCDESERDFDTLRRSVVNRGNTGYAILKVVGPDGMETLAEAYGLVIDEYVGAFTVVRSLAMDWKPQVGDRLEQAYGLTASEVEICRLVFELCDLEAVAEEREVSIETVRTQVKRIFGKLGLHSKAELVKLLAMLCARTVAEAEKTDLAWSDPLGRERILTRLDGRKLAYSWIGAEHGREVLFIHGDLPMFYLEVGTQAMLAEAGVKLICLSMPGHGSSDPPPKGVMQLDDGLDAIEFLMQQLGHTRMPIAASFSGMTYPMALGGRTAPPVTAILLIGLPWNLTPDIYKAMASNNKTISQLALRAPRILDLVCRLGFRMMQREGPDFFLARALTGSSFDRTLLKRADIQPHLRAAVQHLVAQGHSAFVREVIKTANAEPARLLADLKVPLHWIAPEHVTTSGPEYRIAARAMSPLISVETVPDAGELFPFERPEVFVRAMSDLASDNPARRFADHDDLAKPAGDA
ncbi:alpha/beta fold hydrolase [Erythrobacter sp. SDW2]|uniref:alpha/beta fold hydrolase n=1 Tax=Erythrobacter sp. SDW2 TaxID=2907154 RepID=UPI001F3E84D3|nr:alpha/beta fold hydrolase [Erythrobacter sp. SDW2]UIP07712.1 alpha/beta fold hydrolase [Erythrobacter sp. SDW2]